MVSVDDYKEVKDCIYKGERYSARDNGAVMRHRREGMRVRKDDNVWTFGKPNDRTGYMEIAGQQVHRIVAYAFHGAPPTSQHVVDHEDTNRRNNRPGNLRWLTRLENILKNPITRARIEIIFGSVEKFLENPAQLYGYEDRDPNFKWMRTVTKEEAQVSLERMKKWAKERPRSQGGSLGEWIFQGRRTGFDSPLTKDYVEETENKEPLKTQSLTPNAIQLDWKYPVEFLCCPQQDSENSLKTYMDNLANGKVFCKNDFGESTILKFGMTDSENLWVMCNISIGWKSHAITKITYKDSIFYHENMGVFDIGDEPEERFESILKGDAKK